MVERRKAVPPRTFFGGVMAFNRRKSTMDCRVWNFSPAGAKVIFTNAAVIPDQFDLMIARKERSYRARMAWRGVNEAGVEFLGEYDEAMPVPLECQAPARLRGRERHIAKARRAAQR